jgi:tetratricopeptide (TPR) repeat protein
MPFPDPLQWVLIGDQHYDTENYEEAIRSYERVPSIDAIYITAVFKMGKAYSELKDYEKAMQCFEIVLDLDPEDAEAADNLEKLKELKQNPKRKKRAVFAK